MSAEVAAANNHTDLYSEETYKELVEAGVFYGRPKSKTNPKMKASVLTNRGGIEIINLAKTLEGLGGALAFLKEKVRQGGSVLMVGTQPSAQEGVAKLAAKFGFPYVVTRWLGGTLTNFKIIFKRVEYLKKRKTDRAAGAFQKYTKKEQLEIEREIGKLEEVLGGLVNLAKEPDVLLIIDPIVHATAVREANKLKLPIVSFADVDANPDILDYVVVGNNKSKKSIEWFLASAEKAIEEGKTLAKSPAAESTETRNA